MFEQNFNIIKYLRGKYSEAGVVGVKYRDEKLEDSKGNIKEEIAFSDAKLENVYKNEVITTPQQLLEFLTKFRISDKSDAITQSIYPPAQKYSEHVDRWILAAINPAVSDKIFMETYDPTYKKNRNNQFGPIAHMFYPEYEYRLGHPLNDGDPLFPI
jgi:hypothetical protein